MSKKLKAALSFALALVLVLSLGVSAFADSSGAEKQKEKEPEIVQIAFNLATGEACAVRMRELGYDDIRLDGVSYKADAEDGVIAIQLGDLAAAKLLRENTAKAKDLGIDYAKLYIRGGRVLVKDDTGLSSDEIAALKKAVATLMGSVRVGVNIGDIFDLANGEKVKLRVQVCNFIYPAPKPSAMPVKAIDDETAMKWAEKGQSDTPSITTVYVYYNATRSSDNYTAHDLHGQIGIAKDTKDKNDYLMKICFSDDGKGETWKDAKDTAVANGINNTLDFIKPIYEGTGDSRVLKALSFAKKILLSNDKGKTTFRTITVVNDSPKADEFMKHVNDDDKDWFEEKGYECKFDKENSRFIFTPKNAATVIGETDEPAKMILRDKVIVKIKLTDDGQKTTDTDGGKTEMTTVMAVAAPAALTGDEQEVAADEVTSAEPKHSHTWGEGCVLKAATCTETGRMAYVCTDPECGATKTEEIPAKGHTLVNDVCSVCGAVESAPAPAPQPEPAAAPAPTSTEHTERTPTPESTTPTSEGGSEGDDSADAGNGGESGGSAATGNSGGESGGE